LQSDTNLSQAISKNSGEIKKLWKKLKTSHKTLRLCRKMFNRK
jgi:hypothetical protein